MHEAPQRSRVPFDLAARWRGVLAMALVLQGAATVDAAQLTKARTERNVDWVSAGVGGLGGGSGNLTVTGVSGTVELALLYWHGIDRPAECDDGMPPECGDGVYDNPQVSFAGMMVTGVAIGDGPTNCWPVGIPPHPGAGSGRAYRADVTSLVTGNGSYAISSLAAKTGHDGNGASLVIVFDDGNPLNDRDLIAFEGNDANVADGFPGEVDGWYDVLDQIAYDGGSVAAELHVADGQGGAFSDDSVSFSTGGPSLEVGETLDLWDGQSVPDAGHGRADLGSLWDIHRFDLSSLFTTPGTFALTIEGQGETVDCVSLLLVLVDVEAIQPTPTATPSFTAAPMSTPSVTPTPTDVPLTPTGTPFETVTDTPGGPTATATSTETPGGPATATASGVATATVPETPGPPGTATSTTPGGPATATAMAIGTATATQTSGGPSTATPAASGTAVASSTATGTADADGTATATPSTPATGTPMATPTGGPQCLFPCTGDCNANCQVTINELILMVNMALFDLPTSQCLAGDPNGDQDVAINEIITAVNRALGGCPLAPA